MVFTCGNQLQLAHIFFRYFIFSSCLGINGKYRRSIVYSTRSLNYNSLPWIAWVVFVLGGHGFYMWKPLATCTYFHFLYFIFFLWVGINGKSRRSLKYNTRSLNYNSLPWVAWVFFVLGGHGFHMWKPFAACTYFSFRYFIFSFMNWY